LGKYFIAPDFDAVRRTDPEHNLPLLVVKNSYFGDVIEDDRLIACTAWYQHIASL